jgi:hypothetical protein
VWSIKPPPPRGAPEWRAALRFGRRGGGWPRVPLGRSGTRSSAAVRRRRERSVFTLIDPLRPGRKMTALAHLVRRPKCVGGRGSVSQRHVSVGGVARVVEAPWRFSQRKHIDSRPHTEARSARSSRARARSGRQRSACRAWGTHLGPQCVER